MTSDVSNARISAIIWKMETLFCLKPSGSNDPVTVRRIEDTDAEIQDFYTKFVGLN